jgi:hypothetical protein
MNQFIQRVANYVANEIIVKGLAQSKTFQKFAVRTNKSYTEAQETAKKTFEESMENLSKQATEGAAAAGATTSTTKGGTASAVGPPKPPLTGIPGFFAAFAKEVRKDISGVP